MDKFKLNDGNIIPSIGFGVFQIPNDGTTCEVVKSAIKDGYRHIDTAAIYLNETDVGKAVRECGLPREEIFVTTKLWVQDYEYEKAKKGVELALNKLNIGYIDLMLLHWPYGKVNEAWQAIYEAKQEGKIKSIGVSNFTVNYFNKYLPIFEKTCLPSVNQIECNPFFQQVELRSLMKKYNIVPEAWYPLGHGDTSLLNHPVFLKLAEKYHKNPGQIILKFEIQEGLVVLPKSTNPAHIKSNLELFDFELSQEEMDEIRKLDTNKGFRNPDDEANAIRVSKMKAHD